MKLATIFAKAEGNVSLTYEVISKFCTLPEVSVQVENYRVDRWEFQYTEGISFTVKLRVSILKRKLPDCRYPNYTTKRRFSYDSTILKLRE